MARRFQVAILSDSRLFREAVSAYLALEEEVEIVGSASSIHNLLVGARGRSVDVLLVYPSGRSALPAETLWDVKTLLPASRVVALGCEQDYAGTAGQIEPHVMTRLGQDASYDSVLESILTHCGLGTGVVGCAAIDKQGVRPGRRLKAVGRRRPFGGAFAGPADRNAGGWSHG